MRVLLVEDEERMARFIARGLREAAYAVDVAANGEEALYQAAINTYDSIILDVMIPEKDGFEVCRELRSAGQRVPVLMLTARDAVEDRITGLDTGADDYLTKPFEFGELLARLRALLRRGGEVRDPKIMVADLTIDTRGQTVTREGKKIELTTKVEDLFTLARADAGQHILNPGDFYLDELAGEVVRSVRTLVAECGLSVRLDATGEMPFRGDEVLLRRLLLNLLDNAIKHTPANGSITVTCERRHENYVLTVADTGGGIPVAAQPHIFDRFFRADKARTRTAANDENHTASGAGLGLAIAQWIAEAHQGTLVLLRSDSSGTIFQLKLPVAVSSEV